MVSKPTIKNLIKLVEQLPGIGKRSATRISYFLIKKDQRWIDRFTEIIESSRRNLKVCSTCFNYSNSDPCDICEDKVRDKTTICIVENPQVLDIIESTKKYTGLYHVLGGTISPLENIHPEDLKIKQLVKRVKDLKNNMVEIIMAISPTTEGEVTVTYLAKLLKPTGIKITRISLGIPPGQSIEHFDEFTVMKSFEYRNEFK